MGKKYKIKINILSPGRFHVCDLARELDKIGLDVILYSFVPTNRTVKYGLPRKCSFSLLFWLFPYVVLERKIFKRTHWANLLRKHIQDIVTCIMMRKCDVLIAMSGGFNYSIKKAKKQGSIIILERGSKHILEQKKIMETNPKLKRQCKDTNSYIKNELSGYQLADYIAIASNHVKRSFIQHDYPVDRLFQNPYGVDLSMFHPTPNIKKIYDVIMVGGWSYRKGCDLIIEAMKRTGLSFLHVGGIVDLDFPANMPNMKHVDAVDQTQLINYYNQAKIFLLPSREEGLAMVQAQAIACNLPLVGSPDSGAEDLQTMVEKSDFVTIIEDYTVDAVIAAIRKGLEDYDKLGEDIYAGDAIKNLTWEAYGKRYASFIKEVVLKDRK